DAIAGSYESGDRSGLDGYTDACLRRVWRAGHFSWWVTSMLHRLPGGGPFDPELQLAQLRHVRSSPPAAPPPARHHLGLAGPRPSSPHHRDRLAPRRHVRAPRRRPVPGARPRAAAVVTVRLRRPPPPPGPGHGDGDHPALAGGGPARRLAGRRRPAAPPDKRGLTPNGGRCTLVTRLL